MSTIHSDYQIRWKNYRRFEDTDWITIKPLTILLGANNGGKTSVLSPLLLLAQTLASDDVNVPLLPSGPLIDLGSYKDFVHLHETDRKLFLGLRYHTHKLKSAKKTKPVGAYAPGGIELTYAAGNSPGEIKLESVRVTDIFNRTYLTRKRLGNGYSLHGAVAKGEMSEAERLIVKNHEPMNFLFTPNGLMSSVRRPPNDQATSNQSFSKSFSHYLRVVGTAYSEIAPLLYQMSYVGPLRNKLQRFYRSSPEMPDTVGSQGEHAANLFRNRQADLRAKVDGWIKKFEFGTGLIARSLTDEIYQLEFSSAQGSGTNVADAGFGASQVLPLIIQAAAAPTDSLTIAEQPEIHLNPRLQCVLADLFAEMATSGHRVLVETHSEHLVLRLRRLIAQGVIPASKVSLYFVEKQGSGSSIKQIPIEVDGNITRESWPKGFFEEGLKESFALATAQAAARKSRK